MLRKNKLYLVLLILISIIPLLDFFKSGLPLTHDGQDHVARIASFYQSLSEGNLIPRWGGDLNWLYGSPVLMFFYPLPSYFGSLFHSLGFSFVSSVKVVFGLSFILSGVFMYLWIKDFLGEKAGLVAGLIYMFAPYRFVDLYVRGAIGECWGFVWPPLVCWFVLKLSKKAQWRYLAGGSLSLAALILSHNALSLMFLPVILGYIGYLIYSSSRSKKFLFSICCLLLIALAFALSFFFWFPAVFEAKYTLRDIVTKGNVVGFKSFSQLLWAPWSYGGTALLSPQIGILQWLTILLAPYLIWRFYQKKDKIWFFLLFLFAYFWLAIFMILPVSEFLYLKISLLQKFQFAWRFLSLTILPPAIFAGAFVYFLKKKFRLITLLLVLLAVLFLNKDYWRAKGFLMKEESFYTQNYPGSTNDTGESSPRWSIRAMREFPKAPMEIIEGEAEIEQIKRKTTEHFYQVKARRKTRLVDNTLYFPNWQVFVSTKGGPASGRDGQPAEIQFQDPAYRGLMTFNVPAGEHEVVVRFSETKLRLFANLVSLLAVVGLIVGRFVIKWP